MEFVQSFLSSLGLNILDVIIIAVLLFYAIEGFSNGVVSAVIDFVSFILSFIFGLKFYSLVGKLLFDIFGISLSFSNAVGFFLVSFLTELLLNFLFRVLMHKFFYSKRPIRLQEKSNKRKIFTLNRVLGIFPGIASGLVLLSFLLSLIVALPLSPLLKNLVATSRFGTVLVANTQGFEKNVNAVFGDAIHDTLNFLTVEPKSDETVTLHFKTSNVAIDQGAEKKMLQMVNKERTSRGLQAVVADEDMRGVARAHAKDMLAKGYFSHFTPEGLSPFDRIEKAGITYSAAGENLAFAPNTDLAMQGLMNSPGHKANILSKDFGRVGIGVLDAGIYGEMFVQEFRD